MPFMTLVERVIERCNDPRSRNYMKVVKMSRKTIETHYLCNPPVVPRIGESIRFADDQLYRVLDVTYSKYKCNGTWYDEIFLEVEPYICIHTYNCGSYSLKEDWPNILDLKEEADGNE